jgi:hypothetical protein
MTSLDKRKTRLVFTTLSTVRQKATRTVEVDGRKTTQYYWKERRIVMQCTPHVAQMRLEGTRRWFPISYNSMLNKAIDIQVEKDRADKAAKKKKLVKRK